MEKKTVRDINVKGKKVLVRVDYNVPMNDKGEITDTIRIDATLPTLNYLLDQGAAIILMAHLGRPKGKVVPSMSLKPCAEYLSQVMKKEVKFAPDCIGPEATEAARELQPGEILMLENLRFHPEEEKNDMAFAASLASLADIYVNNGFGVSHRAHASVEGVAHYLPAVSGFLLEKEIKYLGNAVDHPVRPFAAIVGGAKVADKIGVIRSLIEKADIILIGGGMANTFLAAQGYDLGKSLVEKESIDVAKELIALAKEKNKKMLLPIDLEMAASFSADSEHASQTLDQLNPEWMALDIGPKTAQLYADTLKNCKTIVWNGPMGVFEMAPFAAGTRRVAEAMADNEGITIVGGGDSAAAVKHMGLDSRMKHVSTGGGASLEYLEGKVLPGVAALDDLRDPMVAGNWKCNKTVEEAMELAHTLMHTTEQANCEIVLFPPFTALESVAATVEGSHLGYGSQDLFYMDQGAFTGAVSGPMIAEIGSEYSIVGHSERRTYFGDTDAIVVKKVQACYRNGLDPVLCVGENEEERTEGRTESTILSQLLPVLAVLTDDEARRLVVAYEPLWAIGTGKTATSDEAEEMLAYIRSIVAEKYGQAVADETSILYGGSCKPSNAKELFAKPDIDGGLIGGASLKAADFKGIIDAWKD